MNYLQSYSNCYEELTCELVFVRQRTDLYILNINY